MTTDVIGIIADDFTGATDIGGLLARTQSEVALHTGLPQQEALSGAKIHVIALKIRTAPVQDACTQSIAALERLRLAGARRIYWKYCSTFDSTDKGNIGPVAEALMKELGAAYTLYCPAFPENGRIVRGGHLFVNGVPLSASPMKDHPLTPMRDSDLVRVLSQQVTRPVASLPSGDNMRAATERLVGNGIAHFVADAQTWDDLMQLGAAFGHLPLLTGGSAFAAAIYGAPDGRPVTRTPVPKSVQAGPALIISGSCSQATRDQVTRFAATGGKVIGIDPLTLDSAGQAILIAKVTASLGSRPILVTSTAEPEALKAVHSRLGVEIASARIEGAMARIAGAARKAGATRFVVAGGETSGSVTHGLNAMRLALRNEIAPGVPWCLAEDKTGPFALALKSGNFGGPDFFLDSLATL